MNIAIYTITSALHDAKAINISTQEFLDSLDIKYDMPGTDFTDYGSHALDLIYIRTGGTEGIFKQLLPQLQQQAKRPIYLLTSGKSNSLAASMEILSYLNQQGINGEIIHGSIAYINHRIKVLEKVGEALLQMKGSKLGVIGEPSDWLISSRFDHKTIKEQLGIELIYIPMKALLEMPNVKKIYEALKMLVDKYQLQGFTIRCFDLLTTIHDTGCMALAKLNSEGIVAGCEGDVPALLSMFIIKSLTGVSGFQANPASINPETDEILFAHCTIPFNMVERYELDTHFESGIGVGIRGFMKEGPVTIFKLAGDLSRHFIGEGRLVRNQAKPDLCRTQQVIELDDKGQTKYFLTQPIGNHHIIVPGHLKELLEEILK
jgi:L-fucose isomerase-like protein